MAKSKYIEALEEQYTKKDAKSVLRYKAPDNKWRYVLTSKDASGGNMPSGGGITEVTWQELKDKRDNGELNPGSLYRITDYNCTTTQENTQSAGHQFDIVLLALSENKLAEEGWAMMHDTPIYDVTFADGVTKRCYLWGPYDDAGEIDIDIIDCETLLGYSQSPCEFVGVNENAETMINSQTKTAISRLNSTQLTEENLTYNYFQNSNLSAWKVWYCLDNDTARFAWADDSLDDDNPASVTLTNSKSGDTVFIRNERADIGNFYAWTNADLGNSWTDTLTPTVGDSLYNGATGQIDSTWSIVSYTPAHEGTGEPNGRGVIYRLIDEWNNDVGYDFKNIQFERPMTDGEYDPDEGEDTWVYTFSNGFVDISIPQSDGEGGFWTGSKRNYIGQNQDKILNDIVAISCNDCEFKVSSLITLSYCDRLILSACGGEDSVFSFEYDAIYINDKKVLTES